MYKILLLALCISGGMAQAKTIPCPELFLTHLFDYNAHEQMKQQGKVEGVGTAFDHVLENGYLEVVDAVAAQPELVNCVDEIGQTPLSYSLNVGTTYCPYLKAAQFLLDHGASVNQIEEAQMQTPIFYAIQAYGSIFGKPPFEYQKNVECLKEIKEPDLKDMIKQLFNKGANPDLQTHTVETVRSVAREMNVSFLLSK